MNAATLCDDSRANEPFGACAIINAAIIRLMRIGPYGWSFPNSAYWKVKKSYTFKPKYFEGQATAVDNLIVNSSVVTNKKKTRITYNGISGQNQSKGLLVQDGSLTLPAKKNSVKVQNGKLWVSDSASMRFGSGSDYVEVSHAGERALIVDGVLDLGSGDNSLNVTGQEEGIHVYGGQLIAGDGNDRLTGINRTSSGIDTGGIRIAYGSIDTGAGDDTIIGLSEYGGYGFSLWSGSSLQTGSGNDVITGDRILFFQDALIDTGDGNDTVDVSGFVSENTRNVIDMGAGIDRLRIAPGNYSLASDSSGGFTFDLGIRGGGYVIARGIEMVSTDGINWVSLQGDQVNIY